MERGYEIRRPLFHWPSIIESMLHSPDDLIREHPLFRCVSLPGLIWCYAEVMLGIGHLTLRTEYLSSAKVKIVFTNSYQMTGHVYLPESRKEERSCWKI